MPEFEIKATVSKNKKHGLAQFIVEQTPLALWKSIPLSETQFFRDSPLRQKEIEFTLNGKKIVLTFERSKA